MMMDIERGFTVATFETVGHEPAIISGLLRDVIRFLDYESGRIDNVKSVSIDPRGIKGIVQAQVCYMPRSPYKEG